MERARCRQNTDLSDLPTADLPTAELGGNMYEALLRWLEATTLAQTIAENDLLFPSIEAVHVMAITLVIGTIFIVDLRLLGLASLERAAHRLMGEILPITWSAFALAVVTGLLLFIAKAHSYGTNFFFLGKMVLLALAGLNMLMFHFAAGREAGLWGAGVRPPRGARIAAGLSLTIWLGVVVFGRWIGFTLR
jgi:hypothetical protein